jgi:hypothetical protein
MRFFYHDDGGADGFVASTISFAGPWQLHNIMLRFSTGNVSDTSLEAYLVKYMPISVLLASTHSLFVSGLLIMNVSVSGITSIMLRESWGSMIEDFYLNSEDYIRFDYSMKSGINSWALDVDGWAVLGK